MTAIALPDSQGGRAGLVGIVADVTAEAGAETAMGGARDTADTASRLKSDFLANMSHEIRTPMSGVIGMTDSSWIPTLIHASATMHKRSATPARRSSPSSMNSRCFQSRGRDACHRPEDFALRAIVDDVADLLASSAQSKGIELVAVVDTSVPHGEGDAGRLRQILMNLVGNAIKFTQVGEVVIRVSSTRSRGEAGGALRSSRHRRWHRARKDRRDLSAIRPGRRIEGPGTGRTASGRHHRPPGGGHGGRIRGDQRPQGSTFWFTIPTTAATWDAYVPASAHADLTGLRH